MLLVSILVFGLANIASTAPTALSEFGSALHHQFTARQRGSQFSFENWTDGKAKVNCKSGKGGSYTVSWSGNKGNFVCGKGHDTAEAK